MLPSWPRDRLGEGLKALARKSGLPLPSGPSETFNAEPPPPPVADENVNEWMEASARWLGLEATALSLPYPELDDFLRAAGPAIARVAGGRFVLVVSSGGRHLRALGEDAQLHRLHRDDLADALEQRIGSDAVTEVESLLDGVALSAPDKARAHMIDERLHDHTIDELWLLRLPPGARVSDDVTQSRVATFFAAFLGAYLIDYSLFLASWWLVGRGALRGQIDWGWLGAWALLFATMVPFRMLSTWYEGRTAVAAGGLLKQRLLLGAMRLDPDETRRDGVGRHLARVLESEAVESLAMSGGLRSAAASLELVLAVVILALGSGGIRHSFLLVLTVGACYLIAWRYYVKRRAWTASRFQISHDVLERMVGHRTRLAQLRPEARHEREDDSLATYQELAREADGVYGLLAVLDRLWLPVGIVGLAPSFILGEATLGRLAVALGGTILAARALKKLAAGLADLLDAGIAWERIAPLFDAASREQAPGDPSVLSLSRRRPAQRDGRPLLEVKQLSYRYATRTEPVIRGMSFGVKTGERILLTSPSGGGKSTLISLVNGLRVPATGTMLLDGVDRLSLGVEGWTRRIATAPQFHDNHVFTEVFAFNLLMGRRWPPTSGDWREAEALCRELGLGELLDKMPGGMNQIVGDTGWRLSHGERSRMYLARTLLQNAELVLLDESFAALDPDNLRRALNCARAKAETLLVIAHP
jgi:ATP-binding cassette subfamily B protein